MGTQTYPASSVSSEKTQNSAWVSSAYFLLLYLREVKPKSEQIGLSQQRELSETLQCAMVRNDQRLIPG